MAAPFSTVGAASTVRHAELESHRGNPYSSGVATSPSFELVGRGKEQARLVEFAARLPERPGALPHTRRAGHRQDDAVARGHRRLLRTRGYACSSRGARRRRCPFRWERSRICSILPSSEVSDALAPPAATRSRRRAGHRDRPRTCAPDRLTLLRALVAALRALAGDAPLLLAIDDVQWKDPASARVLSFAVRRIGEEPIGVLATLRGAADEPDPLGRA